METRKICTPSVRNTKRRSAASAVSTSFWEESERTVTLLSTRWVPERLQVLIGQPGSSLVSRTRIKTLAYETILDNCRFFNNDLAAVPRMALTVGVQTVMDAKEVVLVVTGQNKALALSQMIEGGVNHMVSPERGQ